MSTDRKSKANQCNLCPILDGGVLHGLIVPDEVELLAKSH